MTLAEEPLVIDGRLRLDDVYSVMLTSGDVIWELWRRFGDGRSDNAHMHYVWRLRWRTFIDDDS